MSDAPPKPRSKPRFVRDHNGTVCQHNGMFVTTRRAPDGSGPWYDAVDTGAPASERSNEVSYPTVEQVRAWIDGHKEAVLRYAP